MYLQQTKFLCYIVLRLFVFTVFATCNAVSHLKYFELFTLVIVEECVQSHEWL